MITIQIQWDPVIFDIIQGNTSEKLFSASKKKMLLKSIQQILKVFYKKNLINTEDSRELSFYFCNNEQIKAINQLYRKKDKATDVLAFPFEGSTEILGEVIISIEKAYEQAIENKKLLNKEIISLLIHGILHILGYDHEQSIEEAKIMFELEKNIFNEVFKLENV